MNKQAVRIKAKEVIEEKLGLKVSNKDIVLLEASTAEGGRIDYILFNRYGFDAIEYRVNWDWVLLEYRLYMSNVMTGESMEV